MSVVNFVFLTTLLLKFLRAQRINPNKVVYAINCGSEDSYMSKDGYSYLPVF